MKSAEVFITLPTVEDTQRVIRGFEQRGYSIRPAATKQRPVTLWEQGTSAVLITAIVTRKGRAFTLDDLYNLIEAITDSKNPHAPKYLSAVFCESGNTDWLSVASGVESVEHSNALLPEVEGSALDRMANLGDD